jgi:uncharacterized protein YcbK (DUF882 family)
MLPDGLHFKAIEFACHDGTPYPEAFPERWTDLRDLCDGARIIHGGPLDVVSGFRTPDYNGKLVRQDIGRGIHGVASGSEHTKARAADLRAHVAPATSLYSELVIAYEEGRKFTTVDGVERNFRDLLGGIGVYAQSNWVHIDTAKADDGHLRRWIGR